VLDWLYRQNPRGRVVGFNAWHQGLLAAHYALIPIMASFRGSEVKAGLSLNTATHPSYQRRGLFARLAEATYARARAEGMHHVIGVANANSTDGFVGKLGFQSVGQLEVRVGLEGPTLDSEVSLPDTCWRRQWESDDLAWRLCNPAGDYRRRGGDGCSSVLASTRTMGIQAVLMVTGDAERERTIERTLSRTVGLGPKMWIGRSRRLTPAPLGLPLPEMLKRSPLNLVFRPLADPSLTLDPWTVEFEAIDFDAY
jgi:hypothetical protein